MKPLGKTKSEKLKSKRKPNGKIQKNTTHKANRANKAQLKNEGINRVRTYKHTEVKDGVQITEFTSKTAINMKKELRHQKAAQGSAGDARDIRSQRYPGRKVVDPRLLQKYDRGAGVAMNNVGRTKAHIKKKLQRKDEKLKEAEEEAARAEVLLTESSGLLEMEEGSYTNQVTQTDIRKAVDITAATKSFDLKLQFGPYKMNYSNNGRHLVVGGHKGHLAAFDWMTKKLHFEVNVMESIHDVCFLHNETMIAAAQKEWVYVYDNFGVEIHCLKKMNKVHKLEFLPYHFLLCAGHDNGFLSWLDVTLGQEVVQIPTYRGRINIMRQNPYNAVLCCGHGNGTVSMWTPNSKKPVATMLCHTMPITAIDIDPTGKYLATTGVDRKMKVWDARNMGDCIKTYTIGTAASHLAFSQKSLLAVATGNVVEVYKDVLTGSMRHSYMQHRDNSTINSMSFCPYEDVLGISTYHGFSSLLIPGAGEPNFDALEANPYISTSGRREAEVKSLLAKVPSNLITLDPATITQVDIPTLQEKIDAKQQLLHVKAPKINVQPRNRMKGKSGSAKKFIRKKMMKEGQKQEYLKAAFRQRDAAGLGKGGRKGGRKDNAEKKYGLLNRFSEKKS